MNVLNLLRYSSHPQNKMEFGSEVIVRFISLQTNISVQKWPVTFVPDVDVSNALLV